MLGWVQFFLSCNWFFLPLFSPFPDAKRRFVRGSGHFEPIYSAWFCWALQVLSDGWLHLTSEQRKFPNKAAMISHFFFQQKTVTRRRSCFVAEARIWRNLAGQKDEEWRPWRIPPLGRRAYVYFNKIWLTDWKTPKCHPQWIGKEWKRKRMNWQEDGSGCAEKRYGVVEKTSIHDLNKKACQKTRLWRRYCGLK